MNLSEIYRGALWIATMTLVLFASVFGAVLSFPFLFIALFSVQVFGGIGSLISNIQQYIPAAVKRVLYYVFYPFIRVGALLVTLIGFPLLLIYIASYRSLQWFAAFGSQTIRRVLPCIPEVKYPEPITSF